jgi:hypothetical protein
LKKRRGSFHSVNRDENFQLHVLKVRNIVVVVVAAAAVVVVVFWVGIDHKIMKRTG